MKRQYYFIAALVLFVVALFGFGSRVGLALQAALRGAPAFSSGLIASLAETALVSRDGNGLRVPVYSQYPLNLKNQLSIAAGSSDGVVTGDVAMANGYLVGIVEKVFERSALVQTIFDKRFQAPVRIGTAGVDALLRGANDPLLTLIPADAAVSEGDEVYAAAKGTPYGAPIGSLRNLHDAGDRVFRQAVLYVPYDIAGLEELTIAPSSTR